MEIVNTGNCKDCAYRSFLFDILPEDEFDYLSQHKTSRFFKKGEVVVAEGQEIQHFLYLKTGLVKVYKQGANRRDQIIEIAKPLDFVGMLTIFSDTHYHYTITAIEDSFFCFVDLEVIKGLMEKHSQFTMQLLQRMSRLSDQIIKGTYLIMNKNLRGRIAYTLLDFAENIYQKPEYELPVSRKEIGELIGMTTENVIRILSEFRKDGLIHIEGKKIEILNRDRLFQICKLG